MGARFLLLAIVCIALMLLDRREQHLVRVRQALSVVVYPVRVVVDFPFKTWGSLSDTFAERDTLRFLLSPKSAYVSGQVVRVGPLTSEAVLITDADLAVPVSVNRNGLRTIAVGTGDSGRLRLPYLTNNADIAEGDLLLSSGLGGVFPSGYPVGRVLEVRLRPDQAFAEIIAEPASSLDRDREVLLVWSSDEDAPRALEAEPDASVADVQ